MHVCQFGQHTTCMIAQLFNLTQIKLILTYNTREEDILIRTIELVQMIYLVCKRALKRACVYLRCTYTRVHLYMLPSHSHKLTHSPSGIK